MTTMLGSGWWIIDGKLNLVTAGPDLMVSKSFTIPGVKSTLKRASETEVRQLIKMIFNLKIKWAGTI